MATALAKRGRPRGLLRFLLRLPIWLYRLRAGWLLGGRFLLLEHRGRRTGATHRTVLEVVDHDPASGGYVVAAGWGPQSDWYRNIQHTPAVKVWVGRRRFAAVASILATAEAVTALRSYAGRHPRAFRQLVRVLVGWPVGEPDAACQRMAQQVPLVRLAPPVSGGTRG